MRRFLKWICLLSWIVFIVIGCSLFKDVATQRNMKKEMIKSSKEEDLKLSLSRTKQDRVFLLTQDSGNSRYQVLLWPKGQFSFNTETGFVGEAEKLMIEGNVSSLKTSMASKISKESEETGAELNASERESSTTKDTGKLRSTSVSWKWVLVTGLIAVMLIAWLYRKFKRINLPFKLDEDEPNYK